MKAHNPSICLTSLCHWFGVTRQAYYKQKHQSAQQCIQESLIVDRILTIRKRHPSKGVRKLHDDLQPLFADLGMSMGRDALYAVLSRWSLLARPRRKRVRTTDSRHRYRLYADHYNGFVSSNVNQAWVADITYWSVAPGKFYYISLLTDAYSRMILGYTIADSLHADHCVAALEMALSSLPETSTTPLIHHSDRGSQYCSDKYVSLLAKHEITISMTQCGDPLDNAIAERVNGIIKTEYLDHRRATSLDEARAYLAAAVHLYNAERQHLSLNMQTPADVHYGRAIKPVRRLWKLHFRQQTLAVTSSHDTDNRLQDNISTVNQ